MNKKVFMILMCCGVVLFAGCSKTAEETPQQAAKLWIQALMSGDHAAANEHSTTQVHFLNAKTVKNINDDPQVKAKLYEELRALESSQVVIEGDTAKIYKSGDTNNPLLLKKVNGKWRVDFKETL